MQSCEAGKLVRVFFDDSGKSVIVSYGLFWGFIIPQTIGQTIYHIYVPVFFNRYSPYNSAPFY